MKIRGENDFRVKGENIGQPEVIFRKMIFSVTAKHADKGENDFLKSFSPKTNAPLNEIGKKMRERERERERERDLEKTKIETERESMVRLGK